MKWRRIFECGIYLSLMALMLAAALATTNVVFAGSIQTVTPTHSSWQATTTPTSALSGSTHGAAVPLQTQATSQPVTEKLASNPQQQAEPTAKPKPSGQPPASAEEEDTVDDAMPDPLQQTCPAQDGGVQAAQAAESAEDSMTGTVPHETAEENPDIIIESETPQAAAENAADAPPELDSAPGSELADETTAAETEIEPDQELTEEAAESEPAGDNQAEEHEEPEAVISQQQTAGQETSADGSDAEQSLQEDEDGSAAAAADSVSQVSEQQDTAAEAAAEEAFVVKMAVLAAQPEESTGTAAENNSQQPTAEAAAGAPAASDAAVTAQPEITADVIETAIEAGDPAALLLEQPMELALAQIEAAQSGDSLESQLEAGMAQDSQSAAYIEEEIEALEQAAAEGNVDEIIEALDQVEAVLIDEDGDELELASEEAAQLLANQPLVFIPNLGQVDAAAKFYVRSLGGTLYFARSELVLSLPDAVLKTVFKGSNQDVQVTGSNALQGVYNYLNAADTNDWVTDVPLYDGLTYSNIYNGINLTYEDGGGTIKSTYTVSAGADPSQILWSYLGAESVSIDDNGNLIVTVPGDGAGEVTTYMEQAPVSWQEVDGQKTFIQSCYRMNEDGSIGYSFGDYDLSRLLIIDPLTLGYSTYLGGSTADDIAYDITVDSSGNTYVTGQTASSNFPTSGSYQTDQGGTDAFVSKFNSSGGLVYSTYLGGSGTDAAYGIQVDGTGQAFVTGETTSADGFMTANAGGVDAFITKLNAAGNALDFSTNLGGAGNDIGYDIALDNSYNAYITGSTNNNAFVSLAGQGAGGGTDTFVAKYSGAGALQWSTYLGGAGNDIGYGIDVDASGNSYITGSTDSAAFPTTAGVYDTSHNGGTDAFISKLTDTGAALSFSTYFGGTGNDAAKDIAVDSSNRVYITGFTDGSISTVNGYSGSKPGNTDAFIARFDASGASYQYGSYLGGSGDDYANAIQVDNSGNAYIAGYTTASIPITNGYEGDKPGSQDAFVARFDTTASGSSSLVSSTYLGGAANDIAYGIALDGSSNIYVAGATFSSNFPLANAYDGSLNGGSDAFVTKLVQTSSSSSSSSSDDDDDELTPYEAYLQYLEALWNAGYYYYYPYYYPCGWNYDYWTYSNTRGALNLNSGINSVSLPPGSVPVGSFPYVEMRNLYGLPAVDSSVTVIGQPQGFEVIDPYARSVDWLAKPATIMFRIPDDTEVPAGKVFAAQHYDRFSHSWVSMPVRVLGKFAYLSTSRTGTFFLALVPAGTTQMVYPASSSTAASSVSVSTTSKTINGVFSGSASLEEQRDTIIRLAADGSANAAEVARVEFTAGASLKGSRASLSLLPYNNLPAHLESAFSLVGKGLKLKVTAANGNDIRQWSKAAALLFTLPQDFDLPAGEMLVVAFYEEESGMWYALPVSLQGRRVSALATLSGSYVLAQTARPQVVDVLDSSLSAGSFKLEPQKATSIRFYHTQKGAGGKKEYYESFRLVFEEGAAPRSSRAGIHLVEHASLPPGLESGVSLLRQAFELELSTAAAAPLKALNAPASLRFTLMENDEIPAGKKAVVYYYDKEDGAWFRLPAARQHKYVFAPANQAGLYALALEDAD